MFHAIHLKTIYMYPESPDVANLHPSPVRSANTGMQIQLWPAGGDIPFRSSLCSQSCTDMGNSFKKKLKKRLSENSLQYSFSCSGESSNHATYTWICSWIKMQWYIFIAIRNRDAHDWRFYHLHLGKFSVSIHVYILMWH